MTWQNEGFGGQFGPVYITFWAQFSKKWKVDVTKSFGMENLMPWDTKFGSKKQKSRCRFWQVYVTFLERNYAKNIICVTKSFGMEKQRLWDTKNDARSWKIITNGCHGVIWKGKTVALGPPKIVEHYKIVSHSHLERKNNCSGTPKNIRALKNCVTESFGKEKQRLWDPKKSLSTRKLCHRIILKGKT